MTIVPIRAPSEQSKMETVEITTEMMKAWVLPDFQAPLRINKRVESIAEDLMQQAGIPVISGVITLGTLMGSTAVYLLDGQHRREAAIISQRKSFLADVRTKQYDSIEAMAQEYLHLNTSISRKTPDDQLRALHESLKPLQYIVKECDFVGYKFIRANPDAPLVGMSALLRRWNGSHYETPHLQGVGSAVNVAFDITMEDAEQIVQFLKVAYSAWGRDLQNVRLWSGLNMTMCMWLWRVLVLDRDRSGSRRYVALSVEQFRNCLMSVSANTDYVSWLTGRNMTERERSPCYKRLRLIFIDRIREESAIIVEGINVGPTKVRMPQPEWSAST